MESVAVSRDGADVPRGPRRVADRGADFRHQVVQARVGDERLRPQTLEKLCLRDSLRPPIEQDLQQLEGLRGKRHGAAVAKEHPPAGVELAFSKNDTHRGPERIRFHENSARTAWSAGAYIGTGDHHDPTAKSCCLPDLPAHVPGLPGTAGLTQGLGAKIWVGRYQEIEEYLRTAECVSMEVFASQQSTRCTLRPGGPVARMAWRALPPGVHRGFTESYRGEIAAYELDKLLKMDMVPPSVERQIQGNKGAAQLWVEHVVDAMDPRATAQTEKAHWEDQLVRMTMFDTLIGNRDRNLRNMLRDRGWNLDSARSFTKLHRRHRARHKLNRIDEGFWATIESLTRSQLDAALGRVA